MAESRVLKSSQYLTTNMVGIDVKPTSSKSYWGSPFPSVVTPKFSCWKDDGRQSRTVLGPHFRNFLVVIDIRQSSARYDVCDEV